MYSFADLVDAFGRLHIGSFTRTAKAAITVDPDADDVLGIALDVAPTRASVARKAAIKLGNFTLTQDPAGDGTLNFGIVDADGTVVFSTVAGTTGGSTALYARYLDAIATSTFYHLKKDTSIAALAVIDGTTPSDATFYARANALKTAFGAHLLNVGSLRCPLPPRCRPPAR